MGNRKQSIYSQEFRDEMARECHELLLERKTTVSQFAEERNISRKCLYSWTKYRYPEQEIQKSGAAGFVKITGPAAVAEIDYYGARIRTGSSESLVQVLSAIRKASVIQSCRRGYKIPYGSHLVLPVQSVPCNR